MITFNGKTVTIEKGEGYWALNFYPWGGSFHRLAESYSGCIDHVIDRYSDGSVKRFVVILPDGTDAGFTA